MNINTFNPGDTIVRTRPAPHGNNDFDRSYIGEKLTLRGVTNGLIYLQQDSNQARIYGKTITLELDRWYEGWEFYQEPPEAVQRSLREEIERLIAREDYETLREVKAILDEVIAQILT